MTTLRGLNQSINYFFRKLGFDKCVHAKYVCNEFSYNILRNGERYVFWSFQNDNELQEGFNAYLDKKYPDRPVCSDFVFGLLHELGHDLTIDYISDKAYLNDEKNKKKITQDFLDGKVNKKEAQIKYCGLYVERVATEQAIQLLINNYDEVVKFEKRFFTKVKKSL